MGEHGQGLKMKHRNQLLLILVLLTSTLYIWNKLDEQCKENGEKLMKDFYGLRCIPL
jgi:hypothetical protein